MKTPQSFPVYLPAFDRRLEHAAGLLSAVTPQWDKPASSKPTTAKQWLGVDFSDTIVTR